MLLLEARPFAMELRKQLLTSQSLAKLEPRNLAKTCSSMGYLAVIDSVTSEVRILLVLDGKGCDGNSRGIPQGLKFWLRICVFMWKFFREDSKKEGLG